MMMLAAAVSGAGTVASVASNAQADRERRRAISAGMEEESRIQNKANTATKEYVEETYDPTQRLVNYEEEASGREKALGDLLAAQEASGEGAIDSATGGAVSDTYTQARARAAADAAKRSRTNSRLMARAGATGGLFGSEALVGSDYASDMLGFGVDSRLNQRRTNSQYGAASGGNLAALGGLLQAAGGIMTPRSYANTQAPAPVVDMNIPR
jgi:hypothetical protein